ncbi:mitochondrial fission regulator 2-like [Tubulanus polymorphus]|uniref:mitochondrial fission regulator 2-like n=1 Tax=Tubulanus polymorphus TaxID=672921 RepID=UPI003DA561EE
MDVFGFFGVIRTVLDFLGFDLFQPIPDWLVDDPDGERQIKRRSLIRRIGSAIPIHPARRIRIQTSMVRDKQILRRRSLGEQSNDSVSLSSLPSCANFGDVVWLDEQSFCNGIRHKIQIGESACSSDIDIPITPPSEKSSYQSFSTPDPVSLQRISELQDELEKMRQQIASIVTMQMTDKSALDQQEVFTSTPLPIPSITVTDPPPAIPVPPPAVIGRTMAPPPPPPPPPPPIPVNRTKTTVADIIKQNKAKKAGTSEPIDIPGRNKSTPNMGEVLKGLGTVKLRSIARSPGGTPLRQAPKLSDDPANMIAFALKKKFANARVYSPDKENINNPASPCSPNDVQSGIEKPSLVKPSSFRRKSNQTVRSLLSPLAERNC